MVSFKRIWFNLIISKKYVVNGNFILYHSYALDIVKTIKLLYLNVLSYSHSLWFIVNGTYASLTFNFSLKNIYIWLLLFNKANFILCTFMIFLSDCLNIGQTERNILLLNYKLLHWSIYWKWIASSFWWINKTFIW